MGNKQQKNLLKREDLGEDYMRQDDIEIIKTDIPERIQLKFGDKNKVNIQDLKNSIDSEAEWILEKYKNISGISPERLIVLKMKIIQILLSYKEDLNDIPYIITYQKNLYEP